MSTKPTEVLFTPYTLGDLQLKNRIVMAPLTRTRAENQGKVPNELMTEYYAQRAGAGLITRLISRGVSLGTFPPLMTSSRPWQDKYRRARPSLDLVRTVSKCRHPPSGDDARPKTGSCD